MDKFLEGLAKKLEEDKLVIDVEGDSIRLTLDSMGEEEEGVVLLEIMKVELDGIEDYSFYHFFSILAVNVEDDKNASVLDNLNSLSQETLLGNYGLAKEDGIIYHKYVAKVPNSIDGTEYLYSSLVNILAVIDNDYNTAIKTDF